MRTLLFVPAIAPHMFRKARESGADVVIYDLEDAVQPARKEEARTALNAGLAERDRSLAATAIRVNALGTPWFDADVELVRAMSPDYVMLPKTTGSADVDALAGRLGDACPARILAVATETASSVLSLSSQPWAHPRLHGLLWGAEDLAADLGATANRDAAGAYSSPFRLARDLCLMAARRAGVLAIDAVCTDFRDLDGLRREAAQARGDGFDAKAAIHPAQVGVINDVFTPDVEQRRWADTVLSALAASDTGVAVVDGAMVDAPHAARARRILGLAERFRPPKSHP